MLERAKTRREKLDTQLSNAGHDVKRRCSPLKDANALLAQAAGDFSRFLPFLPLYLSLSLFFSADLVYIFYGI